MKKIEVYMNPGIVNTESGTYIVAGVWIRVPDNTKLSEVWNYVERKSYGETKTKQAEQKNLPEKISVVGSNGSQYEVKRTGNHWSCTCPGFAYNRRCKHITETVSGQKEEVKEVEVKSFAGKKITFTKINL